MAARLPAEFLDRLREIHGAEADRVIESFGEERRPGVWANPLRGVRDPVARLASVGIQGEACDWLAEAATIDPADKAGLTASEAVERGELYVQNLSSMLAPLALGPRPGESVLDLAAAPGGKTLHLAARMRREGELAAVEPVRDRFFRLRGNLHRCGAGEFVRTFSHDGRQVGRKTPGRFDAVLLDAPCSGEARFDPREPGSFAYWGPRKLAESARKQKALVRSGIDALRPGGRLLYCTCTFAPEENEAVVAHTLRRLGDRVRLAAIDLPIPSVLEGLRAWRGKSFPQEVGLCVRVPPDERLAGFFLAMMIKQE